MENNNNTGNVELVFTFKNKGRVQRLNSLTEYMVDVYAKAGEDDLGYVAFATITRYIKDKGRAKRKGRVEWQVTMEALDGLRTKDGRVVVPESHAKRVVEAAVWRLVGQFSVVDDPERPALLTEQGKEMLYKMGNKDMYNKPLPYDVAVSYCDDGTIVEDTSGELLGAVLTVAHTMVDKLAAAVNGEDVTDRDSAEAALQKFSDYVHSRIDQSADALYTVSLHILTDCSLAVAMQLMAEAANEGNEEDVDGKCPEYIIEALNAMYLNRREAAKCIVVK